ncbi:MAG TPA: ATP-binding protein [Candidatus Thermoplasmatota archaeon]|nr:ATP-binding protein [Candidatus Thermoplasmatota archaeon]
MHSKRPLEEPPTVRPTSGDVEMIDRARTALTDGDPDRALTLIDDLTRRYRLKEALFASLPFAVVVTDAAGFVEQMNDAAVKLLPASENEKGRSLLALLHRPRATAEDHPRDQCAAARILEGEKFARSFGDVVRRPGGKTATVTVTGVSVERDGDRAAVFVLQDEENKTDLAVADRLLQASLDAVPLNIAVLDGHGRIAAVNVAWRRFGDENGLALPNYGIGVDYVALCEEATGDGSEDARVVAQGIREILDGRRERWTYEYPCHSPDAERWFVLHAQGVRDTSGQRTIVASHEDVTTSHLAEARLRRLNEALEEHVRQRTRALAAANRDLKAALEELDTFSYSVSHDLRAPLRGIEYMARILREEHTESLDDEALELVDRILAEESRMSLLVDDLLELSRVTRTELHRKDIDLADIARDVVADLRAREPGRVVEVAIPRRLPARGDPVLLRAVMENLIENAWKYTGRVSSARIAVGATETGGERVYHVMDNGVGFEASQAPLLFKAFSRLHPASEFPGTGVGLATVERIIRRHGGRVWAEGRPGGGATFRFTLPAGNGEADGKEPKS